MTPEARTTDPAPRSTRTLRVVLAALLSVALIASVAWLVIEVRDRTSGAQTAQSERDTVMLRTRQWMQAAWNYGPADLDDEGKLTAYVDRVAPLISTNFRTDFEQTVALLEGNVAENGYTVAATVDRVGVESLSEDRARVIAGGELSQSIEEVGESSMGYLWRIDLVKVDGEWRVNDFNDFGAVP